MLSSLKDRDCCDHIHICSLPHNQRSHLMNVCSEGANRTAYSNVALELQAE